jgi:hypothetical protein
MPPTPVDDHTQEFEQLAGLQALGILEGEELEHFEQHAARCERCRLMVQLDGEALALAAPEMEPSADFKARLMQRAAAELRAQPKIVPFRRRAPWQSLIAAVLVLGVVGGGGYAYENQVVASYALAGSASGSAVVNVRRSGAAELDMSGVPNPPSGFVYEAWVIPPGSSPIAVGTTPQGDAKLPLERVGNGVTVAITQERARVDAPTSAPILAVVVQS